jgi:hypothetical protein
MPDGNDLMSQMAADSEESKTALPSTERLSQLATLVKTMQDYQESVDKMTKDLAEEKERLRVVSMEDIPNLFDELELSTIKLADGQTVEVKRSFAASITKAHWPAAKAWLEANGHGAIISHDLTIKIKKGEEEQHTVIVDALTEAGLSYADGEKVHPQTLKGFVKEQMEAGSDIPQDVFGVFPVRMTKVK